MPRIVAEKDAVLLDVQTRAEFAGAHFEGATNIPVDELRANLSALDKNKMYYVNCFSGLRSYIACRILAANGIRCSNFAGGMRFYRIVAGEPFDGTPRYLCGIKAD